MEVPQKPMGLWYIRRRTVSLPLALPHQWPFPTTIPLTPGARTFSRFHPASSHRQAAAVSPVLSHALSTAAFFHVAPVFSRALDSLGACSGQLTSRAYGASQW